MQKNILIIGGTRNLGYQLTHRLLEAGHTITVLNRGVSPDDLPDVVHRLHADRTDASQLRRALLAKSFDVVVDFVLLNGDEAYEVVNLFRDNVDHYIMMSTGQVYLVREDIERPFKESEYRGRLIPEPKDVTFAHEEWVYGMNKRKAEDVLMQAWEAFQFPYTTLRLPMVNSLRDPFQRLYAYVLRLQDGGPILVPETPSYPMNHIYDEDVIEATHHIIDRGVGKGKAYNLSQDESLTIDEFLQELGDVMGVTPHIIRYKYTELQAQGFLPDCSPFTERWMSQLDNSLSKIDLGITYTPFREYLEVLVDHYLTAKPPASAGYARRHAEKQFALMQASKPSTI